MSPKKPQARTRRTTGTIVPKGENKWLIRTYVGVDENGKREYASKAFTGTYAQAEKESTKWQAQKDQGTFTAPSSLKCGAYVLNWLKGKVSLSAKTSASYLQRIQTDAIPFFGSLRLDSVTRGHMQSLVVALAEKSLSRRTIQYTISILHGAFEDAIDDGLITKNPCRNLELPPITKRATTILTAEQVGKLLHHPSTHGYLWLTLLTTGLRPNEALALEWKDINFETSTLRVFRALVETKPGKREVGPLKTKSSIRTIPLPKITVDALRDLRKDQAALILRTGASYHRCDIVFAGKLGEHLDYSAVARKWKADLKSCGLPKETRVYDTRHTYASILVESGEGVGAVKDLLGHSTIKTTVDNYVHLSPAAHRKAADTFVMAVGAL